MVRVNDEIAAVLQEYADLLAITGGDAFRVRTYEKAARSVGGYPEDLSQLDETGLRQIPNVGASIAAKIEEQLRTGAIHQLEELRAKVPAGVRRLTTIPTLGPKKAMELYEELGDLIRRALRHGAVFAINSDSHATPHLAHLRYGVATAQRGWLTPDNVINTWPLGRLQEFLRKKRHLTPLR